MARRNVLFYGSGFIVFILVLFVCMGYGTHKVMANKQQSKNPPLLLSSGLTEVSDAEVHVLLWFEGENDCADSSLIEEIRSIAGWKWDYQRSSSNGAITLTGSRHLKASEEAGILTWFQQIAKSVESEGGKAFLDERVQAGIDIRSYLEKNGFQPVQEIMTGKTFSAAGRKEDFFSEAQAGPDSINIQLLSRSTSQGEKTVLAIPVLLEEF